LPAISLALSGSSGSAPAARPKTAAHAAIWWCVRGTVSMLFSIGFVIGLAHYLTMAWSHPLGWWPVVVVVSGALVALRAWVRGASGPGVAGMLAWGGLTWLLVLDRAWPAGSLLLLGWAIAMYRNR
jgi:hypothetical protein